jgi:hypothetical protein
MFFLQNFALSQLVKSAIASFVVCSLQKKIRGGRLNFDFFGFCAAVFLSTATPKNNLIVLK